MEASTLRLLRGSYALVASLAISVPTAAAAGGGAEPGVVWSMETHPNDTPPSTVSIGGAGSVVFSANGLSAHRTCAVSVYDVSPPSPVWDYPSSEFHFHKRGDSAGLADVHAYLSYRASAASGPKTAVLEKYSTLDALDWSYTFSVPVTTSAGDVHVSDDGSTIVAWVWDSGSDRTEVAVFDPDSANPRSYTPVDTLGEPVTACLSADGSSLYLATRLRSYVFDVESSALVHVHTNWYAAEYGSAISADGSVFAQTVAHDTIEVYRRDQSGTYQLWRSYDPGGTRVGWLLDLSDDGSVLGCGFNHYDNWLDVTFQILDLRGSQVQVVHETQFHGQGSLQNTVSSLCMSAAGDRMAVGLAGDETGSVPELVVFEKRPSSARWHVLFAYDLPGSVFDLDLSHDGEQLVVASSPRHGNIYGGGGTVALYRLDQRDLWVSGKPSIGNTVELRHLAGAARPGRVLLSPSLLSQPMPFPRAGALVLDPGSLTRLPGGIGDTEGVIGTDFAIPNDVALVGTTLYFQGLALSPRVLSESYVSMTILP